MLLTVILNSDFDVLPAHIEICDRASKFVAHGNLCLRSRQARLYEHDPKPGLFRRLGTGIE